VKERKRKGGLILIVFFLYSSCLFSHHSESSFDMNQVVSFPAIVKEFLWRNPHVYIIVETNDDSRNEWQIETGATPIMMRSGWTDDSLQVGDEVFLRIHPERTKARNYAMLVAVEKADGTVLSQNPAVITDVNPAKNIYGTWRATQESIDIFFEGLSSMSINNAAQSSLSNYNLRAQSPAESCTPYPIPRSYIASNLFLTELLQLNDSIRISSEYFDVSRTISIGMSYDAPRSQPSLHGHSTATVDGDSIVVRTSNFSDNNSGNGNGIPSSQNKSTIEKYYLINNRSLLRMDFILDDPDFIDQPFVGFIDFEFVPNADFYPYECDLNTSNKFRIYE
jgi:hypothetical protein